jgi:pilus assembly protein CpaB
MRIGSIVMLGAALVFGLAATFLAKIWLENQTPPQPAVVERPAVPLRTVVVATKPLRFGMEVPKTHLKEIEWPEGAVPKGSFSKISDILDGKGKRLVLAAIAANEPVLKLRPRGGLFPQGGREQSEQWRRLDRTNGLL